MLLSFIINFEIKQHYNQLNNTINRHAFNQQSTFQQQFLRISHATSRQRVGGILLAVARVLDNLGNALVATALAQCDAGVNGMCQDMPTNGLLGIRDKAHVGSWVRLHLVGEDDRNVVTVSQPLDVGQDLVQLLLALGEFASANVVAAVRRHDAVNHKEADVAVLREQGGQMLDRLGLQHVA
jgi:hypothetical protein